jgi:putative salt-induced outer membrane protein YdiY
MKKTLITTIVATAVTLAAFAETSTPTVSGATMDNLYPWQSSASAGLTLTRGNSQTLLFTADVQTQKKMPENEFMLGLGGAYGDQNSKDTVNNYKAFGQWNHLFTERFFGYVRADALRDIIADLDYRFTVGPGVGYYLIKETNTTLAVEAGAAFEAQKLGKKDDTFVTARLAERFEHKFSDRARVWQSVEFLPQVDKLDNYLVNFEIGLEASLTKSFSLKTYLDDNYQNRPAAGKLKNDLKLVAAVAYKF